MKTLTKRQAALITCRIAGYHNNAADFTRALILGGIARDKANEEWRRGIAMRESGIPCHCQECKANGGNL